LLFIEYDVNTDGEIQLVALINAVEEDDADPEGEAWLAWRSTHEDEGLGCVAIVEGIILTDRAYKEEVTS
jgi:hypothetical protein